MRKYVSRKGLSLATRGGIAFVALAAALVVVWFVFDFADEWALNVAPEAAAIAATILIVERIIRREGRERIRPRSESVLYWMGLDFRLFMSSVHIDYASTHIDTFRPLPDDEIAMLDQWLADPEDEPRRLLEGRELPTLLLSAIEFSKNLDRSRERDLDVLDSIDPEIVRKIDDLTWAVGQAVQVYGFVKEGLLDRTPEREQTAHRLVVEHVKEFALVLRKYAPEWMKILDLPRRAAAEHRQHYVRARRDGRSLDC